MDFVKRGQRAQKGNRERERERMRRKRTKREREREKAFNGRLFASTEYSQQIIVKCSLFFGGREGRLVNQPININLLSSTSEVV